jgi:hypothetical protein
MRIVGVAACLATAFIGAGCSSQWRLARPGPAEAFPGYRLAVPAGWMTLRNGDTLTLSRHDPQLEYFRIIGRRLRNPFENTKLRLEETMSPFEKAEIVLSDIALSEGVQRLRVLKTARAVVDGSPAILAELSYMTPAGLRRKELLFMIPRGTWYYEIRYSAVQRYYYDKYVNVAMDMVNSLKFSHAAGVRNAAGIPSARSSPAP